jgi:hypothetical protein
MNVTAYRSPDPIRSTRSIRSTHSPRSTHAYPARLRLRFAALRGDPFQAARVAGAVRAIAGVLDADASPATGSLLLTYRMDPAGEAGFWQALEETLAAHGLSCGPTAQQDAHGRAASTAPTSSPRLDRLAERAADALVGALAERLCIAALGALL